MAYADGGIILANDYNTRLSTVNNAWSTGSGSYGYGQPSLSSVIVGNKVIAGGLGSPVEWAKLIDTVNNLNLHQTGSSAGLTVPVTYDIITWLNNFDSVVNTTCNTSQRFGSYSGFVDQSVVSGTHTASWGGGGASITNVSTVRWSNADSARYFFNAGGRVNISFSYSGSSTPQNNDWATMVSNAGTMWVQAESSGGTATNTSRGYWQSGGTLYSGSGISPTYASNSLVVSVSGNGGAILTFTTVFRDNHTNIWWPAFPNSDVVTGTFTVSILVRRPTTTGLDNNTWGLASVSVPNF